MKRNKSATLRSPAFVCVGLFTFAACAAFGQAVETGARFDIADVHASAKSNNPAMRIPPARRGRYEVRTASMVDLISVAYGWFDKDKILGGPSWLEMDRFDVIAQTPVNATPETVQLMLQSLLAERFKLALHKDVRDLPGYALMAGKKPQLKEADGSGQTGCRIESQASAAASGGGGTTMMMNGTPFTLGPGRTIQYACRNMTMEAFAAGLGGMRGGSVGPNPVLDRTGLEGMWNFDVRWTWDPFSAGQDKGDRVTVFEALEKQLGLRLEPQPVPTPVIVVDSVNEKPTPNPPGIAEKLPIAAAPTAFEVADIKPSAPNATGQRRQILPGGRLNIHNMTMRSLLSAAFDIFANDEELAGVPNWVDAERFDITAQAPSAGPASASMDQSSLAPMLRVLLEGRFKLKMHNEDRVVSTYTLTAGKPKLKKADPASRTRCTDSDAPPGSPRGTVIMACQNITMAQFADRLQGFALGYSHWPVTDATGIEGGWDFSLTWVQRGMMPANCGRGGDTGQMAGAAVAQDPCPGLTLAEAIEKQLGLKLEMEKRPMPVIVIDHLEEKPTDN